MANADSPTGLSIWGPLLRARMYGVETAPAMAIYHNQLVETESKAVAGKHGNWPVVLGEETGAALTIVGVTVAVFDDKMDPVKYLAASEAGDSTMAGYVLVADHPEQEFIAQEDSASSAVCGLADAGQCADMVGTGGSTSTGLSSSEIDTSTVAATATLALQLLYPHPDDDNTLVNCRWICKINTGWTRTGVAGV